MVSDINLFKEKNSLFFKKISIKREVNSSDFLDGYYIDADEKESRKIVDFLKNSKEKRGVAIKARDELFNRRVIETMKFDYLVSPEINLGKDTLKQRSSGLNHVLVNEAQKKGIVILVSLQELQKRDKKGKVVLTSRIIQNIKLCRKAKCAIKIASFSEKKSVSKKERGFIGMSWGMSSQQIKDFCAF
jgi:RNase P/RNase MRP subunit p30